MHFSQGSAGDLHGWVFQADGANWAADFTLSYRIAVNPAFPDIRIRKTKTVLDTGDDETGPFTSMTTAQWSGGALPTVHTSGPAGGGLETAIVAYGPVKYVDVVNHAAIPSGRVLTSFVNDFSETTVPEPSIWLGVAGAGLALIFRRRLA